MAAPKREYFKAPDVCQVAQLQPFVLRSWEAEFPQLGKAPAGGGPRLYARADVDMVLRIKDLVFREGLTLAGARRRLEDDAAEPAERVSLIDEALSARARDTVRHVRDSLRQVLAMLSTGPEPQLQLAAETPGEARPAKSARGSSRRR
jgi:DNA-binding transcriptional MerR regulator